MHDSALQGDFLPCSAWQTRGWGWGCFYVAFSASQLTDGKAWPQAPEGRELFTPDQRRRAPPAAVRNHRRMPLASAFAPPSFFPAARLLWPLLLNLNWN